MKDATNPSARQNMPATQCSNYPRRPVKYRFLRNGEHILRGDEWFDERDATWNPTTEDSWGTIVVKGFRCRKKICSTTTSSTVGLNAGARREREMKRLNRLLRESQAELMRLRDAIERALSDSESGTGWGPDVSVCSYLRDALSPNDQAER